MYIEYPDRIVRDDGAAIPRDPQNTDYAEFVEWRKTNEPRTPDGPSFEQRVGALLAAVVTRLNAAARAKGYDDILSASLRAALPESPFHTEGVIFGTWMDQNYAACYQILAQVKAGDIEEPTEVELIAMLPAAPAFDNR